MVEAVPSNSRGRDDYPRMLYHADGRTMTVDSPEAEDPLLRQGWSQRAQPAHQRPVPTPSVAFGGGDPLAVMIRNVLEAVLDERGIGRRPAAHEKVPEMPPRSHHKGESHGR